MKGSQGFASMDKDKQKEISSKGGRRVHELKVGHEWNSETAAIAGRLGGLARKKRLSKPNGIVDAIYDV